jgi:RNA polymerase sigma factor (sigma-70 family)
MTGQQARYAPEGTIALLQGMNYARNTVVIVRSAHLRLAVDSSHSRENRRPSPTASSRQEIGVSSVSLDVWLSTECLPNPAERLETLPHKLHARDRRTGSVLQGKVELFFHQHHGALIKFFTARLHCLQDAKDVAQETYAWLLQHQNDPRVVAWLGPINPLVYRVAWNIAGNKILKHRRHGRLNPRLLISAASAAPAPEQVCAAHEALRIIDECLEELPARCRAVFVLARLEDMSFEEIARRMEISVRSVYRHVDRALDLCSQRLCEAERSS